MCHRMDNRPADTRMHLYMRRRSRDGSPPVTSCHSSTPKDHTSAAGVAGSPCMISGACGGFRFKSRLLS